MDKQDVQRKQLKKALSFLQRALQEPEGEFQRAAVIQAFEFSYELSWKFLKTLVEANGGYVSSPKAVFREAAKIGLIDNPDQWFGFLEARNLTVHTYVETVAEKVYKMAKEEFAQALEQLTNIDEA